MIPRLITRTLVCVGVILYGAALAVGQEGNADGDSRASSASRGNRLLIVAPQRFHDALSDFVPHKNQLLPTELVSLEHVLSVSTGVDDPERLKQFLYSQWRERQVGYVLLVGDVDVMPVRYMVLDRVTPQAFDYAFYPSDLYYSDLAKQDGSFDDWNGCTESFHAGYFGEVRGEKNKQDAINFDAVDYRPDVAVGRWPVSNEVEVQCVAAKTMVYETGVLAQNKVGQDRAAILVVGGWVDARGRMNRMADALAGQWSVEKRFYSDGNPAFTTPPPDETQLLTLLNDGVGLVIHAGHGTDVAWEQCFSVQSFERLHNADRLPVVISAGCSTAICGALGPYQAYVDVDGREHEGTDHGEIFSEPPPPPAAYQSGRFNPTGLGEQLLRQKADGAVAYIGCNTGSQPCGLTLVEGFTKALTANPQARLGDCWSDAVAYYYQHEQLETLAPTESWYPASIFFQGMKFMLFGDPSLSCRLQPAPSLPPASAGGAGPIVP
ncbi:MAG: C25 family cysteine peptidase [Pirellulaceae bacterium]